MTVKLGEYICEESLGICGTIMDLCERGIMVEQEDGTGFSVEYAHLDIAHYIPSETCIDETKSCRSYYQTDRVPRNPFIAINWAVCEWESGNHEGAEQVLHSATYGGGAVTEHMIDAIVKSPDCEEMIPFIQIVADKHRWWIYDNAMDAIKQIRDDHPASEQRHWTDRIDQIPGNPFTAVEWAVSEWKSGNHQIAEYVFRSTDACSVANHLLNEIIRSGIRDKELVPILEKVVLNIHSPELAFRTARIIKNIEATPS